MPPPTAPEIGLTVFYVCAGTALVVIAWAVAARASQFQRHRTEEVRMRQRQMNQRDREADLREAEIKNAIRSLDLRERKLRLDEADALDRDEREDDGYGDDSPTF